MRTVTAFLAVMCVITSYAQESAERINFAHHYNLEEEIRLDYISGALPDGNYGVMISVKGQHGPVSDTDFRFTFRSLPSFQSGLDVPFLSPEETQAEGIRENEIVYFFSFPQINNPLLLCEIRNVSSGVAYFIDFRITDRQFPEYLKDPTGFPAIGPFINEGRFALESASPLEFDIYDNDFPAARPPMSLNPGDVPRTMEISSSFTMDSSYDHIFDEHGLYVARAQDSDIRMVFRAQGPYFPEYVTLPSLVDPLVYITTRGERETLMANVEDKQVFDRFWLEMTGSKERAKWIIKNYFRRVTEANLLFTSYKEGWKTDRGMMYIIFGSPDEVIRNETEEVWYYENGLENEKLLFSFRMIKSPYAERQYVLNRQSDLSDPWMAAVRYWRQGMPIKDVN